MSKRGNTSGTKAPRAGRGLGGLSVSDLRKELAKRERRVGALLRKRERIMAKVRSLDATIAEHGGSARAGGLAIRRRPKNDMNLVDALAKVLDGKTMSVTEVSQAVQDFGYKTTSPSFRTIVNQTLINSGKFKRVARGQYTAK
ncbi:MAG TPA: hypothetical protein PKE29_13565 [Phycisphaerales bacterium]|nr:hypothetical protein [Phycisphaerales bacterium]